MRTLNQLMSLKGRTALVTGACGFLGQAICQALAELGCNLILLDLPGSKFSELKDKILDNHDIKITLLYTIISYDPLIYSALRSPLYTC